MNKLIIKEKQLYSVVQNNYYLKNKTFQNQIQDHLLLLNAPKERVVLLHLNLLQNKIRLLTSKEERVLAAMILLLQFLLPWA